MGWQGQWRQRLPLLLPWDISKKGTIIGGAFLWYQVGRPAEGFSPHRTNNQGGRPPYLEAAIVPGQGGRLCRGPTLALALWRRLSFGKDGHQAEGFSPHRTNNQGGLPPYLRAA